MYNYEYAGFLAKIENVDGKWKGNIAGINIDFEGTTEDKAIDEFHRIVEEHIPEPD